MGHERADLFAMMTKKNAQEQAMKLFNHSRGGNGFVLIKWRSWHGCRIIMRGFGLLMDATVCHVEKERLSGVAGSLGDQLQGV